MENIFIPIIIFLKLILLKEFPSILNYLGYEKKNTKNTNRNIRKNHCSFTAAGSIKRQIVAGSCNSFRDYPPTERG